MGQGIHDDIFTVHYCERLLVQKLRVLIIDGNDLDMRMRLKHSITSTAEFGECLHVASTREALSTIESADTATNIVFISYHFNAHAIKEFAGHARQIPKAQDSALVMILASGSTKETTLAESMMAGIDGFLLEPFSTDDLVKVTKLAGRVSKEKSTTREYVALKMLVRDQIRLLDAVYCLKRGSIDSTQTEEKLKALGEKLPELPQTSIEMYYSLLIDCCERSMIPIAIPKNPYQGKSERARRKVDQMLISNLENPKERLDPKKEVLVDGKVMKLPLVPRERD